MNNVRLTLKYMASQGKQRKMEIKNFDALNKEIKWAAAGEKN